MLKRVFFSVVLFGFAGFANSMPVSALKLTDDAVDVPMKTKLISQIKKEDLVTQSKADNISFLFDKAKVEGAVNFSQKLKYAKEFKQLPNGDEVLLSCLKTQGCSLENAISIASTSQLHNLVFIQSAPSSLAAANKLVGNVTEGLMHKSFIRSGWKQMNGEIGVNGIDGLYVKRNKSGVITDVLIAESKYNKSGLNETANGTQMSKEWITANIDKLIAKYPDNNDYKSIKTFIDKDSYRALVWNAKVENDDLILDVKKVHSRDGSVQKQALQGGENINPTYEKNRIISLGEPTNSYQMALVSEFNTLVTSKSIE